MTREEARKAAEVMLAYAEGKTIEYFDKMNEKWMTCAEPLFSKDIAYRINESKYRPFKDIDECWQEMQKHEPFGWLRQKKEGYYAHISKICELGDDFHPNFLTYTFADGTPFGIKEE